MRFLDGDTAVRIRYFKDTITVHTDLDNSGQWKLCFESEGVILPVHYYFGMSAVTGDLSDNHDITSFKVFSIPYEMSFKPEMAMLRSIPRAMKFDTPRKRVDSKDSLLSSTFRSPIKTFLVSVVVIVGAVFAIAVAYLFYKDREEKKMKRFY